MIYYIWKKFSRLYKNQITTGGTQYEKDPEKLKVIRNPNRTSWTYTLTQGKTNYLNFMIRGFKRTKSGIVLYTPYICGYMA